MAKIVVKDGDIPRLAGKLKHPTRTVEDIEKLSDWSVYAYLRMDRIRYLHRKYPDDGSKRVTCVNCGGKWPCATWKALNGEN